MQIKWFCAMKRKRTESSGNSFFEKFKRMGLQFIADKSNVMGLEEEKDGFFYYYLIIALCVLSRYFILSLFEISTKYLPNRYF